MRGVSSVGRHRSAIDTCCRREAATATLEDCSGSGSHASTQATFVVQPKGAGPARGGSQGRPTRKKDKSPPTRQPRSALGARALPSHRRILGCSSQTGAQILGRLRAAWALRRMSLQRVHTGALATCAPRHTLFDRPCAPQARGQRSNAPSRRENSALFVVCFPPGAARGAAPCG